jgi:hypothetical protein
MSKNSPTNYEDNILEIESDMDRPWTTKPTETDAPTCPTCGCFMRRTGTCHTCDQCGYNKGCG